MILYGVAGAGIVGLVVALLAVFVLGRGGASTAHFDGPDVDFANLAGPDARGAAVAEEHGGARRARQAARRPDPPERGPSSTSTSTWTSSWTASTSPSRPHRDQAKKDGNLDFITELHTHATDGIIHLESPTAQSFSLGQFFGVWGLYLAKNCIGGLCSPPDRFTVYVNGQVPATGRPGQARPPAARRDRNRLRHAAGDDPVELQLARRPISLACRRGGEIGDTRLT